VSLGRPHVGCNMVKVKQTGKRKATHGESVTVKPQNINMSISKTQKRRACNRVKAKSHDKEPVYLSLSPYFRHPKLKLQLREWRNEFSIQDARRKARSGGAFYTVFDAAAGGGLASLAAQRANMKVIATTECDQDRVDLVSDLTGGSACLGDHFSVNFRKVRERQGRPNVYLSGFPCRDWAHSGNKQMTKGSTGWMYEAQVESILELEPDVAVLEQTDGILEEPENHTLLAMKW
jgi:hypothetical protein